MAATIPRGSRDTVTTLDSSSILSSGIRNLAAPRQPMRQPETTRACARRTRILKPLSSPAHLDGRVLDLEQRQTWGHWHRRQDVPSARTRGPAAAKSRRRARGRGPRTAPAAASAPRTAAATRPGAPCARQRRSLGHPRAWPRAPPRAALGSEGTSRGAPFTRLEACRRRCCGSWSSPWWPRQRLVGVRKMLVLCAGWQRWQAIRDRNKQGNRSRRPPRSALSENLAWT